MTCSAIVIAKEKHKDDSTHLNVALFHENASRYSAAKLIRHTLPEWEGSQCWVAFHKAWGSLSDYVTKERRQATLSDVWGKFSLDETSPDLSPSTKKKAVFRSIRQPPMKVDVVLRRLRKHNDWLDVLKDPQLERPMWGKSNVLRQLWQDVQNENQRESTLMEGIASYLWNHDGWKDPLYSPPDLGEKYFLLDWLAVNRSVRLSFPIKTRQLFIYGEPSTQKTLLITILEQARKIYTTGSRRGD